MQAKTHMGESPRSAGTSVLLPLRAAVPLPFLELHYCSKRFPLLPTLFELNVFNVHPEERSLTWVFS